MFRDKKRADNCLQLLALFLLMSFALLANYPTSKLANYLFLYPMGFH